MPPSNIILMMADDVANSGSNPFPGQLFNKPSSQGVDVYAGCNIDYRGQDVTAQLFLDVLQGNKAAVAGKGNGKVLESTKGDNVFVAFFGACGPCGAPRARAQPRAHRRRRRRPRAQTTARRASSRSRTARTCRPTT